MPHLDTKAAIGERWAADAPGSIQIWAATPPVLDAQDQVLVEGQMKCDLILCIEGGPVIDLKWMPMGAWDQVSHSILIVLYWTDRKDEGGGIPKLGIIAACQLDGSVCFYAVPQPQEIRARSGISAGATLHCKS
jgi:transcription factor C subunit 6